MLHLFDNVPLDMLVSPAVLLVGLFFLKVLPQDALPELSSPLQVGLWILEEQESIYHRDHEHKMY